MDKLQQNIGVLFPASLAIICLIPSSMKRMINKPLLTIRSYLIATLKIWSRFGQSKEEETFNGRVSELATRNLFSWTFFTEGVRTEEKLLWKHEWLQILVNRELIGNSSASSSSGIEDETENLSFGSIERWREDVSVQMKSDSEN